MNQSELPPVAPAPLWRRLGAIAYDLLIVVALLVIATIAAILTRGGSAVSPESVWFQVLLLAIWWLYFAWSWAERGQTVGMRAWRLVLRSDDGKAVSWARASVRFVAAGLSAAVVGLGFLWCLLDRDHRAWHDRLSRTRLRVGLDRASHRSRRIRPELEETRSRSAKPGDSESGDYE